MSLVEVVVAVVILAILSTAVLAVILKTQAAAVGNRSRIAAASLAAREIDLVREEFLRADTAPVALANAGTLTNPHPLDGQVAGVALKVDAVSYTVVRSVAWNITGSGASPCAGGTLVSYPTLGVTVVVTWPNMGSISPVVSTATLAPIKSASIPGTASFVAVQVVDSAGAPNPGRTVTVSGVTGTNSARTDTSGCAVVQVAPAVAGTAYTATMSDPGYVDISGTLNPSKLTGTLTQGQLSSAIKFAYDRAGTVRFTLVDAAGVALAAVPSPPPQVTVAASQSSGASSTTTYVVAAVQTVLGNRWPMTYGAYYGTVAPLLGYTPQVLAPGGTIDLKVVVPVSVAAAPASSALTGTPPGATSFVAVPAGAGCAAATAQAVAAGGFTVAAGTWDFFASGPTFACSPGPAGVVLASGANANVAWAVTTLRLTSVTAGGTVWAVERSKAPPSVTTCPTSSAASAVNVDAARTAPVVLAPADWYLFLTNGAAGGTCLSFPATISPSTVKYGVNNVVAWPAAPTTITLKVSSVPTTPSGNTPVMAASQSLITPGACTPGAFPAGYALMTGTGGTVSVTVAAGTWYIYAWDRASAQPRWNPLCQLGGTMVAQWTNPLTLAFNSASPGTVGP